MKRSHLARSGIAAVASLFAAATLRADDRLRFIVFGDAPYSAEEKAALKELGHTIKAAANQPAFAINYGDTKAGGEACTSEILSENQRLIESLIDGPVFVTPGDNDWTDCDRFGLDELAAFDTLFGPLYYAPDQLPEARFDLAAWNVSRQDGRPENVTWRAGGVQFGLFHIVGTGNGRKDIKIGDKAVALDRVDARDADNLAWADQVFGGAEDAEALVIVVHADMTKAKDKQPSCSPAVRTGCHPYRTFEDKLRAKAADFARPVLFVHGDTGPYCVQTGYLGAANMTRLNGAGDYHPGATEVTYSSGSFTYRHVGEGDGPAPRCDD